MSSALSSDGSSGISDILSSIQSTLQLRDFLDGVGGFLGPILGLF